jgi:SAM-dependent methyltransferase
MPTSDKPGAYANGSTTDPSQRSKPETASMDTFGQQDEQRISQHDGFALRLPVPSNHLDQDEEWCGVFLDDQWQKFRFHDYDRIFKVPGLYEALFYETLRCTSPKRVAQLLREELDDANGSGEDLRVLDLGAGNGMMGLKLHELGASCIVGADIIPEAAMATRRDHPGIYQDYIVADMTQLTSAETQRLADYRFNAMTTVAALGYGDIPPRAFAAAYNLLEEGGWLAFNIKESFIKGSDESGFSRLIRLMTEWEMINAHVYRRYCHRLSVQGKPLYYVAMLARKVHDVPDSLLAPLD